MSLLAVNTGTSSVKISCFEEGLKKVHEGHFKQIFGQKSLLEVDGKREEMAAPSSYAKAIESIIASFEERGVDRKQIKAIGHRVVHGGEKYVESLWITPDVERELEDLTVLAPLHNPPALEGIFSLKQLFPKARQAAVFDTAFHARLPEKAALYPLPYELSKKHRIKRYGFHGIAHAFSWKCYEHLRGELAVGSRVITVHLGSGCSLAAIASGVSVDTSMGFTPLDGVMMATRSGELDPAIVAYLSDCEGKTASEIIDICNHRSGLLGISGSTADMKEILDRKPKDARASLAFEMFIYHIQKKIGAFTAVLQGVDALIFSGGIGENAPEVRSRLAHLLSWCGVEIDEKKNNEISIKEGEIAALSSSSSGPALYVVGCDENRFIAEELVNLLDK